MPRLRPAALTAAFVVCGFAAGCSKNPETAKREYVSSGDRHVAQQQYAEAVVQYRNAVQQDPKFGEARLKLARAYEHAGNPEGAFREYIRAADLLPEDAAVQLKAAELLLATRQFEDARARAERAAHLDPRNANAQIVLGTALAGLRDLNGALKEVQQALELAPGSAFGHTTLAAIEVARGNQAAAGEAFRKAVETNPLRADVHLALGYFLWASNRVPEAESSLKRAVDLEPANPIANRALATLYLGTGRPDKAEPYFKVLADTDTQPGAPMRLALADYYVANKRVDEANRLLGELAKGGDASTAARTRLAAIAYATRPAEGTRQIDEVLKDNPKNAPALLVKARFLLTENKIDQALATTQAAVAADPSSVQAQFLLGSIYRTRREVDLAIGAFNEVLRLNPQAAAAQFELARLNLAKRQPQKALQLSQDAARQIGDNPDVQLTLARSLLASGEVYRAAATVRPLAIKFPNSAPVLVTLGDVQARSNDARQARQSYARALELDPINLEAARGLAAFDLQDRKSEMARSRATALLQHAPRSAPAHVFAARVYWATGDAAEAERLLKRALELDPALLEAYSQLGALYGAQHRLDQARDSFDAVIARQPRSVTAHTVVALIYQMQGNVGEARTRYERILKIEPSAAVAANNLAYLLADSGGNLDEALQLAQTAKQRLPDSAAVADTLGWVYYKKELPQLAVPPFGQAVAREPQNPTYQLHLGLALAKAGQKVAARSALGQAIRISPASPEAVEAQKVLSGL